MFIAGDAVSRSYTMLWGLLYNLRAESQNLFFAKNSGALVLRVIMHLVACVVLPCGGAEQDNLVRMMRRQLLILRNCAKL